MKIVELSLQKETILDIDQSCVFVVIPGNQPTQSKVLIRMRSEGLTSKFIYADSMREGDLRLCLKIIHEAPNTKSDVIIRTVLEETAKITFDGNIKVDPKSDGAEGNLDVKGLTEGKQVSWESTPSLEIENKESRVLHRTGLTGYNKEQLIYLNTRGIENIKAKSILRESFLKEALNEIPDQTLRERYIAGLRNRGDY
jgi:Fe-S cluster assembly scaffold protein SufB